jgi:adenosylhomocysteine nucleosidase
MKIVTIVSADSEWTSVRELLQLRHIMRSPFGEYAEIKIAGRKMVIFQGGWGKTAAAASTQYVIDHFSPDLLVNIGTCGGFAGRIEIGTTILVQDTLIYDIIEQMGNSDEALKHYSTSNDLSWLPANLPTHALRGRLISADRDIIVDDIPELIGRFDAVAADWESGAIAWVAHQNGMRLLILRSVTDLVGKEGDEVYGNLNLFRKRTKIEMKRLLDQLPAWLEKLIF